VKGKQLPLQGLCRLTGQEGKFVKSHIIPRALAPPAPDGEPFAQLGLRRRPSRRRDSWYDRHLVTAAGEEVLTSYDTWAIAELRRLKLIWQSWGPMHALATDDFRKIPRTPWGMRRVTFRDPARMRLFLLSLLWRAAACDLRDMEEARLPASDLRRLRRAIVSGSPPGEEVFPITLTQISTIGRMHNLGPIKMRKRIPKIGSEPSRNEEIIRMYFDGLIVHFHLSPNDRTLAGLAQMLVGQPSTVLTTIEYEASWQLENLRNSFADAEIEFPGAIERTSGGAVELP